MKIAKSKATAIGKSKKRKSIINGVEFLQNMPSTTATVHARLGILSPTVVQARHQPIITIRLQPLARINDQVLLEIAVAPRALSSVSAVLHSSFITLKSGLWLTDNIINYFAK